MALEDQIKDAQDALINADKAGDVEAAKMLADHIVGLQSQLGQPKEPQQESPDKTIPVASAAAVGGGLGLGLGRGIQAGIREEFPSQYRSVSEVPKMPEKVPNITVVGAPETPKTGGEKWVKALTGVDIPDAQMSKKDLDLTKGMRETVGRGGQLAGGTITESGIMLGPKAAADIAKDAEVAAAAAAKKPSLAARAVEAVKSASPKAINSGIGHVLHGVTSPWLVNAAANTLGGAATAAQAADAYQRFTDPNQGWVRGAVSGLGALGSGAAMTRIPAAIPIGMAVGTAAPFVNEYLDKWAAEHPEAAKKLHLAEGGPIRNKKDLAFEGLKALKTIFTPKETQIVRASEALAPHEGKWLNVTQSDRMRSTGGDLGGPGFSRFQTIDPAYAEAAWGVGKKPTASAIVNVNKRFPEGQAIWSPMIGSETQHHSNQHVFDMLANEFNRQAGRGKLTPELRERYNARLQNAPAYKGRFDPGFDIGNPEMLAEAGHTFDRRGALAEVMSGQGVGGQKGSIIDYPGIMQEMTDPMTVGAPTHSIGTRLFNLSGDVEHRPDLHSAFPYILKGEDYGVAFNPVPKELALRDWMNQFKEFKGRSPGYYDMTRTVPSQQITEDYLRGLEEAGHAEGGRIQHMADGKLAGYLSTLEDMASKSQNQAQRSWRETASMTPQEMAQAAWEAAKFGGSFNPLISAGLVGSQFIDAAKGNTGWGEALGNAALNAPGAVGKAAHAVAPYVRQALPYVGGLGALGAADAAEAAPKPSVMKGMMDDVMQGFAPKAAKEITPGAPHTYGPQATGQWVRDYQPSGTGLPSTPEEWDMLRQAHQAAQNKVDYSMGRTGPVKPDLVQYMGKYRKGTPEERAAQRQSDIDTIKMLQKLRGMD